MLAVRAVGMASSLSISNLLCVLWSLPLIQHFHLDNSFTLMSLTTPHLTDICGVYCPRFWIYSSEWNTWKQTKIHTLIGLGYANDSQVPVYSGLSSETHTSTGTIPWVSLAQGIENQTPTLLLRTCFPEFSVCLTTWASIRLANCPVQRLGNPTEFLALPRS